MTGALEALDVVADRVAALDGRWLSVALGFQLLNLLFRAAAWRSVLAAAYPRERVRLLDVGAAYAAGVALNAFTPARAGEALKIALVRLRLGGSSVPGVAASGGVILLFDALMGGTLLTAAWALGVVPALPQPSPVTLAGVVAAIAVGGAVLLRHPRLRARFGDGVAILRTPRRYLAHVVPAQLAAWGCRIGVAFALLAAFELPATVPLAGLVVVAGGAATLVPVTPGGAGTQQILLVYALQQTATAASALSFGVALQVGVTAVNTLIGLAAMMLVFRSVRPVAAVRASLRAARADR